MEEIWKDIKGYEGLYQVSNLGRVKSFVKKGEKILAPQKNSNGYLRVILTNKAKKKRYFIHRLVAETFILNPNYYPVVNHLDCNRTNNSVNNLEWCTIKMNHDYMKKLKRDKRTEQWIKNMHISAKSQYKAIICLDPKGNRVKEYDCIKDTKKDGYDASCVCMCAKGKRKTHKGYVWQYRVYGGII